MAKGRQPGSKNKPGHSGGGKRRGAGRPSKVPSAEPAAQPSTVATTSTKRKRKPGSDDTRARKRKKSADKTVSSGSSSAAKDTSTIEPLQPLVPLYPLFRNHRIQVVADADADASASSTPASTSRSQGFPNIPNVVPSTAAGSDVTSSTQAVEDFTERFPTYDSNIPPELNNIVSDSNDMEHPSEDTPAPTGIVQAYLDRVQKEVCDQIDRKKRPDCYHAGTFWIRPRDNWFELQHDKDTPVALYHPRVFVWIPTLLLPVDFELRCIFCDNPGAKMTESGWNNNPVARRVVDLDSSYYILTKRVKCRKFCQRSCNMYEDRILRQLPPHLRDQFPAFLTHRSGIDKGLMTLIRSSIAHGLTSNSWESILRELSVRKHDLAERDYLHSLKSSPEHQLPDKLEVFSPFLDRAGYAGFSPSRWYINQLYVEYMGHIKPYQDQAMAAIPVSAAHMDQSYKAIKYVARLNGVKVFGSLWTMTNEFEQIRQMVLTPTSHLHNIEGPLRGIVKSLHEHGHAPISMLWTDNVKADRQFVERVVPTLRSGVDQSTVESGRTYPAFKMPGDLKIRVASSVKLIDEVCTTILANLGNVTPETRIFAGFALEWDWKASKNGHFPAALMQIAVDDFVYLLQTYNIVKARDVPESLKILLFSHQIVKVGYHVQGTLEQLSYLWELAAPSKTFDKSAGWIDLGVLARSKGLIPHASISLSRIAEETLGRKIENSEEIRCSEWCQSELSSKQRAYAIQDAWLPLHIFRSIVERPAAGARLSKVGLPGEQITLRNGAIAVAHGRFVEQMTQFPVSENDPSCGYIKISRSKRVLIRIDVVLAPAFLSSYHHRTLAEFGPVPFEMVVDLSSLVSREKTPEFNLLSHGEALDNEQGIEEEDGMREESNDSDSESRSSDSDSESDQDNPPTGHADNDSDEFEEFMDPDIDAYIATHPDGPIVQPAKITTPQPTLVFQDIWHLMNRVTKHIGREHSLAKEFSRLLRDTIFLPDKIDKTQIEAVLKRDNITWEQAVRSKPAWIWERVRRYVPQPDVLTPVLMELFASHKNLKCSKSGIKLFNPECKKAADLLLEDVRKGWVSDPPGVAMYNRVRLDKYGLWVYHDIRGTNGLEGGVHHTVRSKFGSLGASVELTVGLLSDYCFRKNIESGSRHRDGVVYDGHYDPWIEDDIDVAYSSLPFDLPRRTRPGYINVSLFKPTQESFIIAKLPQKVLDEFDIPRHDQSLPTSEFIPRIPLVSLSGARTDRYGYLASAQDTKFALVPMHMNEEYQLFNKEVSQFMDTNGVLNSKQMARWWTTQVNGKTIFFKLPEHLQNHFKTWSAVRSEITTLHATVEQRAKFMNLIRSNAHTSVVLDESYSPVVQTRKAGPSAAAIAVKNRVAPVKQAEPAHPESPELPASTPDSRQRRMTFVNSTSDHVPVADAPEQPIQMPVITTPTDTAMKTRKKKECKVCQSVQKNGYDCPGRGDRKRCPYFGTSGAIGPKSLFST